MRFLFISAFYPPHEIGGWEQLTQELVNHLRARGHDVRVLTSSFGGNNGLPNEIHVTRRLRLENNLFHYKPEHYLLFRRGDIQLNIKILCETIRAFQPQAVMVHSMWNLGRYIPWMAEKMLPGHVVYYIADYWPKEPDTNEQYWLEQDLRRGLFGWRRLIANQVLHRLAAERERYQISFDHVIFVSHAVQNQLIGSGLQWARNGCVIHNGVDIKQFSPVDNGDTSANGHLLFVGSLSPHKGLQTVLDAMAFLINDPEVPPVMLQVAGSGHDEHLRHIKSKIDRLGLDHQVQLLGRLERTKMPDLYKHARALVFPSIWQEPLARTTQEAMACGVPVIATLTGGTAELVENGINGLNFKPGDAGDLAVQIKYLWANPELARQMGKAARKTIEDKFNIEFTSTQIENYLIELGKPRQ